MPNGNFGKPFEKAWRVALAQFNATPPPRTGETAAASNAGDDPVSGPPEGWWEEAFARRATASEERGHACGHKQMLTLVAYDITDHKRLSKIGRHCADYGVRVQYSVFECRLEAGVFEQFWGELKELIDPAVDRLVAYKICRACAGDIRSCGQQIHHERVVAYVF